MDLRQLAALVAVADHGTFSAAADELATVQSNVSAHIRRLEREVGAVLVDRQAGRLTEEGEIVADRARRIRAELDALVADVAALKHVVTGHVRAGIIGTTARWLVPPLLDWMGERYPDVEIEIIDATSTSLEPQLESGRLDLALVNLPLPSQVLVIETIFEEDLLLFVPHDHPVAAAERVPITALTELPLLLPPRGTGFRDQLDAAVANHDVTLRSRAELDGIRLIASMTIAGIGAAVLPATAIAPDLRTATRGVSVDGLPPRVVGIALRRRALLSAPARVFLEGIRAMVADDAIRPEQVRLVTDPKDPAASAPRRVR